MNFCCLGSNYCPFSNARLLSRLNARGFRKSTIFSSDFIVVRNVTNAKRVNLFFPWKKILVWTHEPRYDVETRLRLRGLFGYSIYVFNVYTGNVFWHNRHFLGSYHYDDFTDMGLKRGHYLNFNRNQRLSEFKDKRLCVGVFAKKSKDYAQCHINGKNIDLTDFRQNLAKHGFASGDCDVVGSGWCGSAKEESGFSGSDDDAWWIRKIELLRNYRFNLAFENTNWPYYVTEKIWQSIYAGCLPIYWGEQNSIYESFEKDSFVDASLFSSIGEIWSFVRSMTSTEWLIRMERCVDAYNREMARCERRRFSNLEETLDQMVEGLSK